jgi:hypothetical protein
MKTWIRRAHILITVGGGLCGLAVLLTGASAAFHAGWVNTALLLGGLLLFVWAIVLGLRVCEGTASDTSLAIFYAIQVVWISTPQFSIAIGMGPIAYVGLAKWSLETLVSLGAYYKIDILGELPWKFGVNVVPLAMIVLEISRSMSPNNALKGARGAQLNP